MSDININELFNSNAIIKGARDSKHDKDKAWLVASGKCYFNSTSGIKAGDELVGAKKAGKLYLMKKPQNWSGDTFTVGKKGKLGVISIKHGLNIEKNDSLIAKIDEKTGVLAFSA